MANNTSFPAISRQVTELILAGSSAHAEEAINETVEQFGDLAVSAFDGGKLSLATLLISPRAWAESLAYFAATWSEDKLEDEPEVLTESLFAHIHGILYSSEDAERRTSMIHEALATDWGTTAFAVLFSTATGEIIELANDIHARGAHSSGQTTSDHDVIPLALEIARTDADAWDRVLFEMFPDWVPGENPLRARSEEGDDDEHHHEFALARTTHELMLRLRKQVPGKAAATPKKGARPSLGEDIFA
jgi:hypothetical protein